MTKQYDPTQVERLLAAVKNLQDNWTKNLTEPMYELVAAAGAIVPVAGTEVWALAFDTESAGTEVAFFHSQKALFQRLRDLIMDEEAGQYEEVTDLINTGAFDDAWRILHDAAQSMDTFMWGCHHLPQAAPLLVALQRAEAAIEEMRTHWRPHATPAQAEIMQKAAEEDHKAISAALTNAPVDNPQTKPVDTVNERR